MKGRAAFRRTVWGYWRRHGRDLPWRRTRDPYRTLVSEVMLQQTQVERVIPRYREWLCVYPTVAALARAPLADVLRRWQGLGYNRRALFLHRAAAAIVREHAGRVPHDRNILRALPGVGPATTAAVCAFAFNLPVVLLETNIRTVYLHHFFPGRRDVADKKIIPLVAATLDRRQPREWYWALMDYGAYLKRTVGNVSQRSRHYHRQSRFAGSDRQIRGAIIRLLVRRQRVSAAVLPGALDVRASPQRVARCVAALAADGLIEEQSRRVFLVRSTLSHRR